MPMRPRFIADFNGRFGKPPKSDFDAHRPVRADEDLDLIFTWRVAAQGVVVAHAAARPGALPAA